MKLLTLAVALCFLYGCQKAQEAPKVAVADVQPTVTTPVATPAKAVTVGNEVAATPVVPTPVVMAATPVATSVSVVATKPKASKKKTGRVTYSSGFPDVDAFKKMSPKEQRAYLVAATNEQRADCLKWNLDRKVKVENSLSPPAILDWGNIVTSAACTQAVSVDQMMVNLKNEKEAVKAAPKGKKKSTSVKAPATKPAKK